nr:helix-turn-helix domain-containing protein [Rhodococcus sp. AD45]
MELRGRGWSIRAASREVGVSRASGTNWARGYSVYRAGQLVRTVAPLDRLAVRAISPRFLSEDERIQVADLRRERLSIRQIATQLNRSPSTISRELRRNASTSGTYRPHEAHRRAVARRARHRQRRLESSAELFEAVSQLLGQRWSPQQISRHLTTRFPAEPAMRLCHKSIYQAPYQPGCELMRPSPLAPRGERRNCAARSHRNSCRDRRWRPRLLAASATAPTSRRARLDGTLLLSLSGVYDSLSRDHRDG